MATEYSNLFCDESDTDGKKYFLMGAIECTPRRTEIVLGKIKSLRDRYKFPHEFKWTRIGNNDHYINIYKSLVDIFLDEEFVTLNIMKFNKGERWKNWSKNEDERFFKCYYYFLQYLMNPFKRYDIYLDDKSTSKAYNRRALYWSLINSFKAKEPEYRYNNKKNLRTLSMVESRKIDMIQLVDVLLKASCNVSESRGKREVSKHLMEGFTPNIKEWNFDISKIKK